MSGTDERPTKRTTGAERWEPGMADDKSSNQWAVIGGLRSTSSILPYGFAASAASRVTARMVAVPPPAALSRRCRQA